MGRFINADSYISTGAGILGNNMFAYCANNPVNYADDSGFMRQPTTVAIEDGARGYFGGSFSGAVTNVGVACGLGAVIALFSDAYEAVKSIASSIAEAQKASTEKGPHTVYVLIDSNKNVQYVGRTQNVTARKNAHKSNPYRKDLVFTEVASNLTYAQARGLEQTLMLYFHSLNTKNMMNNQINGINFYNGNKSLYISAAEMVSGYIWNQISNELLSWAGV